VNVEKAARARAAVAMLESINTQLEQVYTESAKGDDADILDLLGQARKYVTLASARQLRAYDRERKK
jgi:hypothetical protein